MESEHNQICECPLLDELEMPNASLQDGHTAGIVGTRAEHEIGVRNDFAKFYDFVQNRVHMRPARYIKNNKK